MLKQHLAVVMTVAMAVGGLGIPVFVLASSTSDFTQVINAGTLSTDIVDASYVTVANPSVTMTATTFSFSNQITTGTFGTATQQIYVANPDAADAGWTLAMAAENTTDVWDSAGKDFDFNDPTGSGYTDDGLTVASGSWDADIVGGQMTVDASGGTLATGTCLECTTSNIGKGSSAAFSEGTLDSVTLLDAAASSDDVGNWTLQGVDISQKIPAEQPAASDYHIHMVLTVAAK